MIYTYTPFQSSCATASTFSPLGVSDAPPQAQESRVWNFPQAEFGCCIYWPKTKKELHNINLVLIAATHITESIYTPNE